MTDRSPTPSTAASTERCNRCGCTFEYPAARWYYDGLVFHEPCLPHTCRRTSVPAEGGSPELRQALAGIQKHFAPSAVEGPAPDAMKAIETVRRIAELYRGYRTCLRQGDDLHANDIGDDPEHLELAASALVAALSQGEKDLREAQALAPFARCLSFCGSNRGKPCSCGFAKAAGLPSDTSGAPK